MVLRISTFNDETMQTLNTEMAKAIKDAGGIDKVTGFVVDLRNNPGGLLNQAIEVSDAFLDKGEIVSTRGRKPEESERWNAKTGDLAQGKPMVVLINGGSASHPRSSPARCRTTAAPSSSAPRASARARSRR